MSAAEVLAQHQVSTSWRASHDGWSGCTCDPDVRCDSRHQLDALKAAGCEVVQLPEQCERPKHWHEDCLGAWEAISYGADPVSAWPEGWHRKGGVALPDGSFISTDAARDLAAALLAAADAAEENS